MKAVNLPDMKWSPQILSCFLGGHAFFLIATTHLRPLSICVEGTLKKPSPLRLPNRFLHPFVQQLQTILLQSLPTMRPAANS